MDWRYIFILGMLIVQSSILHCLLGELLPLSGDVEIVGTLGYSSQDPWVFSGTVRDNVLFGCEFKEEWYQQVLAECCLSEDIEMFSHGDSTLVGERGVTLSGGQKARITLARLVSLLTVLIVSTFMHAWAP